ncbi:hypothetical protein O4214_20825 [Rhodococcus erythropolis]|uniref:hypothetical protein n=1 Tax=Rhodococcus erythropolis TaxID=1833 RepID=UPI001E5712C1|nr:MULTISPECIES: hypothetical protein [Rhodococcus erythropolis group]MCD2104905.1 hypothetical protein [Rhodococcus qingshengii]MCZ4526434.1 hypothetical protein [Rhodococcus erythropolis]
MKSALRLKRSFAGLLAAGALLTGTAGVIGAGLALTAGQAHATPEEDCAAVRARDHQIYLNLIASLPPGAPIPPEYINPCLTAPSTTATAAPTATVGLPGAQAPGGGPNVGANAPTNFPAYNGTPIVPVPGAALPGQPNTPTPPGIENPAGVRIPTTTGGPAPTTPQPAGSTAPSAVPDRGPGPVPADSDSNIAPAQPVPEPAADVAATGEGEDRDRYLELTLIGAAAFTAAGIGVRGRPGPFSPRTPESVLSQAVGTIASPLMAYARGGQSTLRVFDPITGGSRFFFLIHDETSSHESVIPVTVPPGGHMRVNPDGTVTVFDADGNPVSTIDAPWAYDANGTPIPTHYEIRDGQLVQVVDTAGIENVLYPILADPEDHTQRGKKSPTPARPTKISGEDDGTRPEDGQHWNEPPPVQGHKAPNPPVQKPKPTQPTASPAVEPEPQVPEQAPAQVPEQIPQQSPTEDIGAGIGVDGPGAGTAPSVDAAPATPNETDTPQAELAGFSISSVAEAVVGGVSLAVAIANFFEQIARGARLDDPAVLKDLLNLRELALKAGLNFYSLLIEEIAKLSEEQRAIINAVLNPLATIPPVRTVPSGPATKPSPTKPKPRPGPRLPGDPQPDDPTGPQDPSGAPDSADPTTPSDPGFEPPVDPGTTTPGFGDPEQPSAPEPGEQPAVDPVNPGHIPVDPEAPGAPTQPGPPEFDPFDPDPSTIPQPGAIKDPTERPSTPTPGTTSPDTPLPGVLVPPSAAIEPGPARTPRTPPVIPPDSPPPTQDQVVIDHVEPILQYLASLAWRTVLERNGTHLPPWLLGIFAHSMFEGFVRSILSPQVEQLFPGVELLPEVSFRPIEGGPEVAVRGEPGSFRPDVVLVRTIVDALGTATPTILQVWDLKTGNAAIDRAWAENAAQFLQIPLNWIKNLFPEAMDNE